MLTRLQLLDLFPLIVDVNAVAPYCKPMAESFAIAMKIAGETDPSRCVMIDDIDRTTQAARKAGLRTILAAENFSPEQADAQLTNWRDLPSILERL